MDPYRTHKPPSTVSKVKVVNGSMSSSRSTRNVDLGSHDRDNKDKSPLWHMNSNATVNGFSPSSRGSIVGAHGSGLSGFRFPSGNSGDRFETHQHRFGGKPSFGSSDHYRIASHRNIDHEEAMDIDVGHDEIEEHSSVSTTAQSKMHTSTFNQTRSSPSWKVLNTSKLNLPSRLNQSPSQPTATDTQDTKCDGSRVDSPSTSKSMREQVNSKGPAKKKAIYIVLHVGDVIIGSLKARASAPVKIYAEKLFLELEIKDSSTFPLRLHCTDFSHCTVCLEKPKPIIAFTLTDHGIKFVNEKKKESILDSSKKDGIMNKVVLYLNYSKNSLPQDTKEDIHELFQRRMSNNIEWSEMSHSDITSFIYAKEQPTTRETEEHQNTEASTESGSTDASQPEQRPITESPTGRKILTPKKRAASVRKMLLESEASTSSSSKPKPDTTKASDKPTTGDVSPNKIVTRSRRRKAEAGGGTTCTSPKTRLGTASPIIPTPTSTTDSQSQKDDAKEEGGTTEDLRTLTSNSETRGSEIDLSSGVSQEIETKSRITEERDLLQHHSKMESHISLLGKHSEEQRHTLEHHQKLLSLERAERTRSFERIQELQSTQREHQLLLLEKNETISLLEREVESQKVTVRQLQREVSQVRESNTLMRKVQSDLAQARQDLDEEKVVRAIRDKQLQDKQAELEEIRQLYTEESNSRRRVEEELQRAQNACLQHMDELENQRLFRQTQEQELQTRDERIHTSEQRYQAERSTRINLEDQLRRLRIENEDLRCSRDASECELAQERQRRHEESETFNRERQTFEGRLRESVSSLANAENRLQEMRTTLNTTQTTLDENRRIEPRDWIIRREEVTLTDVSLGNGAWGSVKVGNFRSCKVAVKQIHELILSPHNRRLFEREMSIASRCRHPCLLQFIGATNDDGIPLFITELLDTDLRAVLSRRSFHQEEIISVALDVARALNYLHLSKPFPIIHRDISSSNVLLWKRDTCWRAKLSDYGAANFMRQYMTVNPGAGIYAAPEVSTNQQSPKVDIYSFGLLLCEMCIRELPVPQQKQEQIGLVTSSMLRELVIRCVRDEPDARPSMADIIMLLTQQQEQLVDRASVHVSLNGRSAVL